MEENKANEDYWILSGKINSIKYNNTGDLLFIGDNHGNINIKQKSADEFSCFQCNAETYDESPQIASINKIELLSSSKNRALLLTAIDKSVELWKIYPQPDINSKHSLTGKKDNSLAGVHECTINSLSLCQNYKDFLSSDDLNVYLWDINRLDTVFRIVDHKTTIKRKDKIKEVITSAKFHPHNSYTLLWTSTNGSIRIGDLRTNLLMDKPSQVFKYISASKWYYKKLVISLSYAEFCKNTDCIISRDYFTVKYWDMRNTASPCMIVDVIDNSSLSMNELYQSQKICAEFEVIDSASSDFCITGTYGEVLIINRVDGKITSKALQTSDDVLHLDLDGDGNIAVAASQYLYNFNYDRFK